MNLSRRLQKIINLVPENTQVLWDICCDHGLIGSQFLNSKVNVIFIDRVESITSKLKLKLAANSTDLSSCKVMTANAIEYDYAKLSTNKRNTYIVAGVGTDVGLNIILQILKSFTLNDTLVVSLHKNNVKLRQRLIKETDLKLKDEVLVEEQGKYYEIMVLDLVAVEKITEIGSLLWERPGKVQENYLYKQLNYYKNKLPFEAKAQAIYDQYAQKLGSLDF